MIRARFSPKAARDLDEVAADNSEVRNVSAWRFLTLRIFSPTTLRWGGISAKPRHVTGKSVGSSCRNFATT